MSKALIFATTWETDGRATGADDEAIGTTK
jgi:hypothetical protein